MRSAPFVARRVTASPNIGSVHFPAQETHLRICDGTGRAHGVTATGRERLRDDVLDRADQRQLGDHQLHDHQLAR
jgi:hypothetical protein